jgi:hypothetical protein
MKLLHGFRPATFQLQSLKLPVLLVENGLFGIEHQAIGRTHNSTSMQDSRDSGARYQRESGRRKPTISASDVTFEGTRPFVDVR